MKTHIDPLPLLARLDALDPDELAPLDEWLAAASESEVAQSLVAAPGYLALVRRLYQRLDARSKSRGALLRFLAAARGDEELAALVDLIVEDPPQDAAAMVVAFGPLFQHPGETAGRVFPRLLDGIAQRAVGAIILDLANFVTRKEAVEQHPAAARNQELATLLGHLVQRLGRLEEQPDEFAESPAQLAEMVQESVSLSVALCDALALIGDRTVVGKLFQAAELRHRRLRTEAAAALAKLGEKAGEEMLVVLAAEPVARLRVLAYAEELDLLEKIEEQFQSAQARGEAELAVWLAEPTQLGLPPTRFELLDSRLQYWPGFDEPVDCFLFRFTYELGHARYSNIGIAGPLTFAFRADLADLSPDDIYAAFAGWQAEHEDIYELDARQMTTLQRLEVERLQRRLHDARFEAIQPITLGLFFGEKVLIAGAKREAVPGIAVADAQDIFFYPAGTSRRPLGPIEAYCIYKGRKLLRTFNPADEE